MSRKHRNFAELGCLTLWLPLMPGRCPCNTYETAHQHSVAHEMAITAASTVWQHERYAGHNISKLQRLLELIEINQSPQSFKCVGLIAISQITSISIQCLMCLR